MLPDIVVHRRGPDGPNLLVVEVKISGDDDGIARDKVKLRRYLTENHLRYRYAALVTYQIGERRADFWQLARAREHSVESPFFVAESGRMTNGVIDLLFQSDAGWQVVDYKTDMALDVKAYHSQLDAYRAALRALGCDVVDAAVVSVRSPD